MADYLRESGVKWLWERIKTLLSAKQDKLVSGTNIKTINGASILGSGNIAIEGGDSTGDVDEGGLVWSDEDSISTLMDIAYLNGNGNKIAGIPPSQVTVEYSSDGGATWRDSGMNDASKIRLTNTKVDGYTYIRPNNSTELNTQYQARITIDLIQTNDAGTNVWGTAFIFRKILLECTGIQQKDDHTLTIERQKYNSTTWETFKTAKFWGAPDWYSIAMDGKTAGYPSSSYYRRFRLTWQLGDKYTNPAGITHICFLSDKNIGVGSSVKKSQYTQTGVPYLIDYQDSLFFPGNITATKHITKGGTANQVVLGNGSLKSLDELNPITDADAEILLDNHIHSIDVNANGNDVNISVIESSKNGDAWETEDNDIPIPLATITSAGVMSKEDKIKSDGLLIYYHLTEDEYNNHEIVSLYPLVLAIKDALFDSSTNKWKYDDSKSYDVRVKGWTLQDNGITYLNVNVRLLTSQGGHSIGFSGFVDVDFITETYFDALIPLYIGYICGKYHIENDGMTVVAPEDSGFYIEI